MPRRGVSRQAVPPITSSVLLPDSQARSNRLNKHVKLLLVHITGPAFTLYSAVAITGTQDGRAFAASPDNRPSVPAGRSGQHNSRVTS